MLKHRLTIPEVAPTEASILPTSPSRIATASRFLKSRRLKRVSSNQHQSQFSAASRFLKSRRLKQVHAVFRLGIVDSASRFLKSRRLKPELLPVKSSAEGRLTIPEVAPTEASLISIDCIPPGSASRFLKSRRLKRRSFCLRPSSWCSASRFLKSRRLKRGYLGHHLSDERRLTIPEVAPTEASV